MAVWFKKKKIVSFLVSGSGLNFQVVAKKILNGNIRARIGTVVTDKRDARVRERASAMGVPVYFIEAETSKEGCDEKIIRIFEEYRTDLIVAAGFLRMLSPRFVDQYRNRIINIHPSLLPSFPGLHAQAKALEYGVKVSGCTTHFIDEGMDTGPIIMQSTVSVLDTDTVDSLSARILEEEYRILSESVRLFCEGKLVVLDNRVLIR